MAIPFYEHGLLERILGGEGKYITKDSLDASLLLAIRYHDLNSVRLMLENGASFADTQPRFMEVRNFVHVEPRTLDHVHEAWLGIVTLLLANDATRPMMLDCGIGVSGTCYELVLLLIEHGMDIYATQGSFTAYGRTRSRASTFQNARNVCGLDYAKKLAKTQMMNSTLFTIMSRRVNLQD